MTAALKLHNSTMRSGIPDILSRDIQDPSGPPLYEQTQYQLYLRGSNDGDIVELRHRDPLITEGSTRRSSAACFMAQ
ncbi:MAG: hypothetical protein R3C56_30005 [Pirellulaceae bacterium]